MSRYYIFLNPPNFGHTASSSWYTSISCNNDNELGANIAEAYRNVGKHGVVLMEESDSEDTYVETVKLRAEVDQNSKNISSLWDALNKFRDKNNG